MKYEDFIKEFSTDIMINVTPWFLNRALCSDKYSGKVGH